MARRPSPRKVVSSLHGEEYQRFIAMLVKRRTDAKLTQQEVADRLGWSQSQVAKVEKHERRIDIIELIALASAVGFDVVPLVEETRAMMRRAGKLRK